MNHIGMLYPKGVPQFQAGGMAKEVPFQGKECVSGAFSGKVCERGTFLGKCERGATFQNLICGRVPVFQNLVCEWVLIFQVVRTSVRASPCGISWSTPPGYDGVMYILDKNSKNVSHSILYPNLYNSDPCFIWSPFLPVTMSFDSKGIQITEKNEQQTSTNKVYTSNDVQYFNSLCSKK